MPEPITPAEYRGFQKAYDFFNAELFGACGTGCLTACPQPCPSGVSRRPRFTAPAAHPGSAPEAPIFKIDATSLNLQ
jgi:hypothetical protein